VQAVRGEKALFDLVFPCSTSWSASAGFDIGDSLRRTDVSKRDVVPIKRPAGRDHNFRAIRRAGADGDCGGTAAGADLRRLDGFLVIFASFPSRLGVDRRARGSAPGSPARVTRHTEREAGASRLGSADQASRTAATTVRSCPPTLQPPARATTQLCDPRRAWAANPQSCERLLGV
jgi:hypothetical protein